MATAPANTFQDLAADTAVAAAVAAANVPVTGRVKRDLGADVGGLLDTLITINADSTKRNAMIDNNNLLKGVVMGPTGPTVSSQELIVRPTTLTVVVDQVATIQTTTVEAEYTQQLMESNYTAVSVKASAPYITANADYTQDSSYKNTTTQKTVMVSSRFMFPQGRIDLNAPIANAISPVQLNPSFTSAITSALGQSTPAAQREALWTVFNTYGHVFRTKVRLGGALSAHTMEVYNRSESDSTVKQDIKSGLEVAVQNWGLSTSAAHGSTSTTITTKQGRSLDVKYIVNGGDSTLIQKTDDWITSTTQSANWRVIEVTEATPVVDMLPAATAAQVKTLMTPLFGQWVPTKQVPGSTPGTGLTIYQPKDAIPAGWFFLGYSVDSSQALLVKPTLSGKTGRNSAVVAPKNSSDTPPGPAPPIDGYQMMGSYLTAFDVSSAPGNQFGCIRPGLFLEGNWTIAGNPDANFSSWILHPKTASASEDNCFDLQNVAWQWSSSGQTPIQRFVLRKNAVLFNSS